jgi:3-oxoacyl-[acyl-carrier-protein] synthase II
LKRVVITGLGAVSPLGNDVSALIHGLEEKRSAIRYMEGWDQYIGLRSLVGAPAKLENEKLIPRTIRRSMGRMSIFSAQAADEALKDSGINRDILPSGRIGCVVGSTMGSAKTLNEVFELMLPKKDLTTLPSMKFFQCVSHSASMNIAHYLGLNGYVMATCAACASGLQAVGAGYDLIRLGKQDAMLCGGAEELHPTVTGSFDILFATSAGYNNEPEKTPRPFDVNRDGLVCGEGSGILLLEEYEHAVRRKARIYAEIIGYHTCGSGVHVSQSDKDSIASCFRHAVEDAGIRPEEVDYINAHATATIHGDKEEAQAIREVFGSFVPVSSLKGYIGHTLGASGSLELIASLLMMNKGCIYPTMNLESVSPDCEGICHVVNKIDKEINILFKNCFAFGGINASIVCKKLTAS